MSTQIYPFQFTVPSMGPRTLHCALPKADAEALADALRPLLELAEGRWYYELTGIHGENTERHGPFRQIFSTDKKVSLADEAAYRHALTTFWQSLPEPITSEQVAGLQETAAHLFELYCPVLDKTETPAEAQARTEAQAAAEAAQQAERAKIIAAYAESAEEITLEKGELGIVLALVYDNSDMLTDYYHPRAVKHSFLLARIRKQRRQERLLRQSLAHYPALQAVAWTWHGSDKYSHGPDCYLKSQEGFAYQGTPFKAYSGREVTHVWYEIRFVSSGRYLPYQGFSASTPEPEPTPTTPSPLDPAAIRLEYQRAWTWLFFPAKPDETVRARLRGMGGRWGAQRGGWYFRRRIPEAEFAWLFAHPTQPPAPPTPEPSTPLPDPQPAAVREAPTPGPAGYVPGKGSAYDYLPAWMELPPLYHAEKLADPLAVLKLFTPDSGWTWYLLEYDGHDLAFGLVTGLDTEFGYLSLQEIREARGPLGVQPERDLWFCPTPVTQLPEYRAKWGDHGPYPGTSPSTPEPEVPLRACSEALLPDGWTTDDLTLLLSQLALGPILVADAALGIPTIHAFPDATHVGYGLFRVMGEGYTLYFDGGHAMRRTPSGKGWTQLDIQGDYPYDLDAARARLQSYLTLSPSATPETCVPLESPETHISATSVPITPEIPELSAADQEEFEQWQLELLTGHTHKKNSAFFLALTAIQRPGTLQLALAHTNGDTLRRIHLEKRLHALQQPA